MNDIVTTAPHDGTLVRTNGWNLVRLRGEPAVLGYDHGWLLANEIAEALAVGDFMARQDTGESLADLAEHAATVIKPKVKDPWLTELNGIVAGARDKGVNITLDALIAWNSYPELVGTWWPWHQSRRDGVQRAPHTKGGLERCSAFMATGSYTAGGRIVMAHNTWDRYAAGDTYNVVLDITPSTGSRVVMQAAPGYITSQMDWFVTGAGLMITETTIGSAVGWNDGASRVPEFVRSRDAAQHATSLDGWREKITTGNNGGYANSWLVGDARTGEIALLDLGCTKVAWSGPISDGYFCGFNVATDLAVRNQDCTDPGQYSNILGNGSRRLRWEQLVKRNKGKIDVDVAKAMIADHHDVYKNVDNPCSRTLCGHLERDDGALGNHGQAPFYPWGANDGKVTDSELAKQLGFEARWGSSCGQPFHPKKFLEEHEQYGWLTGHLKDRPTQPWTSFRTK
jgi:hypothetical protein